MRCFSRMLISNVQKSIIVMNSIDTRFSRNVLEAVKRTCSTYFIGCITTRLRFVVLNSIKHSCSFFIHYRSLPSFPQASLSLCTYQQRQQYSQQQLNQQFHWVQLDILKFQHPGHKRRDSKYCSQVTNHCEHHRQGYCSSCLACLVKRETDFHLKKKIPLKEVQALPSFHTFMDVKCKFRRRLVVVCVDSSVP